MSQLVSILIPAYNAQSWLADAIESALAQTWARIEIIIVDDGSRDDTLGAARKYQSHRVKIVSQKNQGASATRNKALSVAQGDYIQWLDADDFLAPDKIAAQMAVAREIQNSNTLLSSAWCRFYYRPYSARFVPGPLWSNLSPVEWMTLKMETNAWMAIESWLVSRELAESCGPWDTSLSMDDDGEYFSRIVTAARSIRFVPEAKSFVRRSNSGSLSRNFFSPEKLQSQFRSTVLQIGRLRAMEDSDRVRRACLTLLQRWFVYFYPEHATIVEQMQKLARELGGELALPQLGWKYTVLRHILGWTAAKKAKFHFPQAKSRCVSEFDRFLSLFEPNHLPK